ncbi:flagellin N-terminal helical domain-containing protein [Humisphaera borealis]|uniref:Flagellin n=1 Tax=Humisphaera borealis TaxID=2807512 RepID=A0A7M2X1A0_9BACT|nr:flagellin [Humisphaera borealis]QOV91516.1 flagellin [Humisphaera borealis]
MSRINTNVTSLIAQRVLKKNNDQLNSSLERLSTGVRINSGKDNPAGLIASEILRGEKAGISTAIENAGRASNILGTAEGGLTEVSSLVTELQGLVNQTANSSGLSAEERQANQLQVDSILGTINRISDNTSFAGAKLLNGNYDYSTSGAATSAFGSIQVNSAQIPGGATQSVTVSVSNSATQGKVTFTGSGLTASGTTLEVAGANGTQQLSFAGSASITDIATAINAISSVTGVTASAGGTTLTFAASEYGSSNFVSVRSVAGQALTINGGTNGKASGTDAAVTINGAAATVSGLDVTYRSSSLDVEFQLTSNGYNGATTAGLNNGNSKTFGITGGGAKFSLGSKVNENGKANIGIKSVSSSSLGNGVVGFLSSIGSGGANSLSSVDLSGAQKIIDAAAKQVSSLRGRLGAFQRFTIGSTVNSLGVAFENASAAESAIRDTDFASETASLTRSQILSQSATQILAQANSAPQAALSLLR